MRKTKEKMLILRVQFPISLVVFNEVLTTSHKLDPKRGTNNAIRNYQRCKPSYVNHVVAKSVCPSILGDVR